MRLSRKNIFWKFGNERRVRDLGKEERVDFCNIFWITALKLLVNVLFWGVVAAFTISMIIYEPFVVGGIILTVVVIVGGFLAVEYIEYKLSKIRGKGFIKNETVKAVIEMVRSVKNKYCPKVDWYDE